MHTQGEGVQVANAFPNPAAWHQVETGVAVSIQSTHKKGTNSLPSVVHSSTRKTASQISSTPRGQIRTIWFITMDFGIPGAIGYKNIIPLWFPTARRGIQRWPPRGRQFSSQMLSHTGWIITIDPDWAPPCGTLILEVWSSNEGQRFKREGTLRYPNPGVMGLGGGSTP